MLGALVLVRTRLPVLEWPPMSRHDWSRYPYVREEGKGKADGTEICRKCKGPIAKGLEINWYRIANDYMRGNDDWEYAHFTKDCPLEGEELAQRKREKRKRRKERRRAALKELRANAPCRDPEPRPKRIPRPHDPAAHRHLGTVGNTLSDDQKAILRARGCQWPGDWLSDESLPGPACGDDVVAYDRGLGIGVCAKHWKSNKGEGNAQNNTSTSQAQGG